MPGLNGQQLAAAVKSTHPGLPVILLTGFGDEIQAAGQLPAGIDLVVSKPVSTTELRAALIRAFTKTKAEAA